MKQISVQSRYNLTTVIAIVTRYLWDGFDLYLWQMYRVCSSPQWSQVLKFSAEVWYTDIRMTHGSMFVFVLPFSSQHCHFMTFKCQNILTQYLVIRWHWWGPLLVMDSATSLQKKKKGAWQLCRLADWPRKLFTLPCKQVYCRSLFSIMNTIRQLLLKLLCGI